MVRIHWVSGSQLSKRRGRKQAEHVNAQPCEAVYAHIREGVCIETRAVRNGCRMGVLVPRADAILRVCRSGLAICFVSLTPHFFSCSSQKASDDVRKSEDDIVIERKADESPLDFVLAIDQSGSMSGTANSAATDPNGLRVEAAKYLISAVGYRARTRVGVLSFGRESIVDVEIQNVDDKEKLDQLRAQLLPKKLGWTNFSLAIQTADSMFEQSGTYSNSIKPVLVIFTDGEPEDERKLGQDAYFEEISSLVENRLGSHDCDVYVIGIDDAGQGWTKSESNWRSVVGSENVVTLSAIAELRPALNRILYPSMQLDVITAQGKDFELPPYLDHVQFHVFPGSPETKLAIKRPDGAELDAEHDKGVEAHPQDDFSIVTVQQPVSGKWNYSIEEGTSDVEVYRNPVPIQVGLLEPASVVPMGRPFKIRVSLNYQDGAPVKELPEHPLRIIARMTNSDGSKSQEVLLAPDRASTFSSDRLFESDVLGDWRVDVIVAAGHSYSFTSHNAFRVASLPYIVINTPNDTGVPLGTEVEVAAQVYLERRPLNVSEYFVDSPLNLLVAQVLETPAGEKSETVFLNPIDNGLMGQFKGIIPVDLTQDGAADVAVRLRGTARANGIAATDTESLTFEVRASSSQYWKGIARNVAIAAAVIFTCMIACLIAWYLRLPIVRRSDTYVCFLTQEDVVREIAVTSHKLRMGYLPKIRPAPFAAEDIETAGEAPAAYSRRHPRFYMIYARQTRSASNLDDMYQEDAPELVVRYGWRLRKLVLLENDERPIAGSEELLVSYR